MYNDRYNIFGGAYRADVVSHYTEFEVFCRGQTGQADQKNCWEKLKMNFSEYLRILKPIIQNHVEGNRFKNNQEYLLKFFSFLIKEEFEEDCQERFAEQDKCKKICNGQRALTKEDALFLYEHCDYRKFISCVDELCKDPEIDKKLKFGLEKYHIPISNGEKVGGVYYLLLVQFLEGQKEVYGKLYIREVTKPSPRASKLLYLDSHNVLHIGIHESNLNDFIKSPPETNYKKQRYEEEICKAFLDERSKQNDFPLSTLEHIEQEPEYKNDYFRYRTDYYYMSAIQRAVAEIFEDAEEQIFYLKRDAYDGIIDTYSKTYENGRCRLIQVMEKITSTTLSKSDLMKIGQLIDNKAKKGLCHMLANKAPSSDDTYIIKSWVNIYE